MRYPITPGFIGEAPDILLGYYKELEDYVLNDICSRLTMDDAGGIALTATAVLQVQTLRQRGYSTSFIKRRLKKLTGLSEAELNRLMQKVIEDNDLYYSEIMKGAGMVTNATGASASAAVSMLKSETVQMEIAAIIAACLGDLDNITQTMGFSVLLNGKRTFLPISHVFQKLLSAAEVKVWSGAMTYTEAIRDVVKQLTDSGLQTVTYEKDGKVRTEHIDSAVRKIIMTGVTKISDQYTQAMAEAVPTDYFEVTAHSGARDKDRKGRPWANHKKWQGRVYSTKDDDRYPNIYKVCGLGEADGLEGVNCRHIRYPFWEGVSERSFTDEELENIDPPPFDYNGKTYSHYEATQRQRALEREIRRLRRELLGYKAAGDKEAYRTTAAKLARYESEYRQFSKAAKLRIDYDRLFVDGYGPQDARKVEKKATENQKNFLANQENMLYSGATITGAYNDENDPYGIKRDEHAERYYNSLRNSDKDSIVAVISKNTGIDEGVVAKMFQHLVLDYHELDGEKQRFDPDYDIAESIRRLREGKVIERHDLLLILHESTEYDLMHDLGLDYERAHNQTNRMYNYQKALAEWKTDRERG